MHINDFLFLLSISKQDQEISPCSCSGLSLSGRGHVLVRCSHTITGLRTLFQFLHFLDLVWNSLVPFTLYVLAFFLCPSVMMLGHIEATHRISLLNNKCLFIFPNNAYHVGNIVSYKKIYTRKGKICCIRLGVRSCI